MIEGNFIHRYDKTILKNMAEAIATYHKCIEGFKVRKKGEDIFSLEWFNPKYKEMENKYKNIKINNKLNKLIKENLPMYRMLLDKLMKMDFKVNMVICHSDFIKDNILFKDKKVKAFLDFDNLKVAPRVEDVAYTLRLSAVGKKDINKKRINFYIKEYKKIMPLSKKEINMIIPLMIRGNVITFWWMSESMKKGLKHKYKMIKENIDMTKVLMKELR